MASWSSQRKLVYGGSFVAIIAAAVIAVVFFFFYKSPTCSDGVKNGDEQAVDCGGSCIKICQAAFLSPRITWGGAKFEKVANGLYNLGTYIENLNVNVAAVNVPYKITLFDNRGVLITEKQGWANLPAHRNTLIFDPVVNVGQRVPAKATFEFLEAPQWFKSRDTLEKLEIGDKKYQESDTDSSLEVTLTNTGLDAYNNVQVAAILYNKDGNAIGFSRTIIDQISPKGGKEIAPFTWPIGRNGNVTSIEVLPVVDSLRDR